MAKLVKHRRISGATRDELVADLRIAHESGASIRALADSIGRSYGFVHRVLREAGVTLRSWGGSIRGRTER